MRKVKNIRLSSPFPPSTIHTFLLMVITNNNKNIDNGSGGDDDDASFLFEFE